MPSLTELLVRAGELADLLRIRVGGNEGAADDNHGCGECDFLQHHFLQGVREPEKLCDAGPCVTFCGSCCACDARRSWIVIARAWPTRSPCICGRYAEHARSGEAIFPSRERAILRVLGAACFTLRLARESRQFASRRIFAAPSLSLLFSRMRGVAGHRRFANSDTLMNVPNADEQFSDGPAEYYRRRSAQIRSELEESTGRIASLMLYVAVLAGASLLFFYQGFVRHTLPNLGGTDPTGRRGLRAGPAFARDAAHRTALAARGPLYTRSFAAESRVEGARSGAEFRGSRSSLRFGSRFFGVGSLYQLICSARTQIGRETLVNWMKQGADRRRFARGKRRSPNCASGATCPSFWPPRVKHKMRTCARTS